MRMRNPSNLVRSESIRPPQALKQLPSRFVPGLVEDLAGRAGLDDPALVEDVDGVSDSTGEMHGVGDDEHRQPVAGQVGHDGEHLGGHARVEGAGRLVEEDRLGLHRQGPRDRHPLLLAAGELAGQGIKPVRQANPVEQAARAFPAAARASPRTWIGASITFWSAVRWGKRLKL